MDMSQNKHGHHLIRVNYNFVCDLERFEKFNSFTGSFAECKKVAKFILLFIEQIKLIVHCQIVSVFVFRNDLIDFKRLSKNLMVQKTVLDGKYVDVIGLTKYPL
jgi:hypothetical protein